MWWADFCGWLGQFFGITNLGGPGYGFWSGVGSDIGELTLIASVVIFYQHHTCHVSHCWRLAKHAHEQDGVTYQLCRKHHPLVDQKLTADAISPADSSVGAE